MATKPGTQILELKIPPVALVIISAVVMWLASAFAPGFNVQFPFRSIVAWVFGLLGVIIPALGVLEFKRAKTTVNPTKPQSTSSLVRTGIYSRTRNPMYLGFFLFLVGWAIAMANLVPFVVLPVFVLYMNRYQIKPEERALSAIFGDEFRTYCSQVRRWVGTNPNPNCRPFHG
jgi:protein-S-isoprenylcysteine O-methyltransferase Ste14